MTFEIIRRVRQDDVAVAIQRHAVLGIGKIFGRQPEIERVLRHDIERQARHERRRTR